MGAGIVGRARAWGGAQLRRSIQRGARLPGGVPMQAPGISVRALPDPFSVARAALADMHLITAAMRRNLFRVVHHAVSLRDTNAPFRPDLPTSPEALASYFDHTLLKPDATLADYCLLCNEAREHQFYSVCVPSSVVPWCREWLKGSGVRVITVVGFPHGNISTAAKALETRSAIRAGCDEVDMVANRTLLKSELLGLYFEDIRAVVQAAKGRPVKVIIETSELTEAQIRMACALAVLAGAAFVKTSTGFATGGATVAAVRLMREVVGTEAEVKASGGVRLLEGVRELIANGATRVGASASTGIMEGARRLGAFQ